MTLDKIPFEREFDMFEEEIKFNVDQFYSKIRNYLNSNHRMTGSYIEGQTIYLTNHLNPNQMPKSVILSRRGFDRFNNPIGGVLIEKNHPLGEQIREDIEKLMRREYS